MHFNYSSKRKFGEEHFNYSVFLVGSQCIVNAIFAKIGKLEKHGDAYIVFVCLPLGPLLVITISFDLYFPLNAAVESLLYTLIHCEYSDTCPYP